MRRRLWLWTFAVAAAAICVLGVPALLIGKHAPVIGAAMAVAAVLAAALAALLARKLGDDAHSPRYITTVRGVGFRFERGH